MKSVHQHCNTGTDIDLQEIDRREWLIYTASFCSSCRHLILNIVTLKRQAMILHNTLELETNGQPGQVQACASRQLANMETSR